MKALGNLPVQLVLAPRQTIRYEGELYECRGRAHDKRRHLIFEADNQFRVQFTDHEILQLQKDERLEILGRADAESARLVADGRKPLRNFDSATAAEKAAVERILKYIRKWESLGCPARAEASLRPIIAEVSEAEKDNAAPSPRTLCHKLAVWVNSGGDIDTLLPATSS